MTELVRPVSGWRTRWEVLRRRSGLAVFGGLATLAVGEAFVFGLPDLYRANATLLVDSQAPGVLETTTVGQTNARLQAIKQEALSRARLTDLIQRFGLYDTTPGAAVPAEALSRMQRDTRVDVTTDMNVNGQPRPVAFTLSYVGTDPQVTADVANALASFYVAQNRHIGSKEAEVTATLLGSQLADMRKTLEQQQARIRAYTARNIGTLPQQVEANLAAVSRLDAQLRTNGIEQLRLLERRQSLQNQIAEAETRMPAADDTSLLSRRTRLQKELADMRTRFSDAHPDVRAALAEIDRLNDQIARSEEAAERTATDRPRRDMALQALRETEEELARLERDSAQLRSTIGGYEQRVTSAASQEPVVDALMRDYQSTRDEYDRLQRRYTEAQLAERVETGPAGQEFRVIDAAVAPTEPSGPARQGLAVLGLALALLVGIGVAALAERLDTSFHSVDDLRAFTSVPILASIPELPTRRGRVSRKARTVVLAGAGAVIISMVAATAFYLAQDSDQVVRVLSRVI